MHLRGARRATWSRNRGIEVWLDTSHSPTESARRILFQRFKNSDYWFLPGGRVEMMEETQETIEREILEEYGWTIKSNRLVWVVENFFRLEKKDFHELGFYFLVQINEDVEIYRSTSTDRRS